MSFAVCFDAVSKRFDGVPALEDVTLRFPEILRRYGAAGRRKCMKARRTLVCRAFGR